MRDRYDPASWYWLVSNRSAPDNIFSAPAGAYVSATDSGYGAFLEAGNVATVILSDGELADVLAQARVASALVMGAAGTSPDWAGVPPADIANVVEAAGCALISTGTGSLDSTYALIGVPWDDMMEETQYIASFGAFSGNPTPPSLLWPTLSGSVTFTTTAELLAVARGLGDYKTSWKRWLAGGMSGAAPVLGSATIA